MADPSWGQWLQSALGIAARQGLSTESQAVAYAIASAKRNGIDKEQFLDWCASLWNDSDAEHVKNQIRDAAERSQQQQGKR